MPSKIEVPVKTRNVNTGVQFFVEAGTTGRMGGDSGHGGRTFVRIGVCGSTDLRVAVKVDKGATRYEDGTADAEEVTLILGGDFEFEALQETLRFVLDTLYEGATRSRSVIVP